MARRLLIVAVCIVATGGFLRLTAAADIVPDARLQTLPLTIGSWQGRDDGRLDKDIERTLQADSYLVRTYTRGPAQVGLYVAYYATQRTGHTIHSPLNCLPGTGWDWLERGRQTVAAPAGQTFEINRAIAQKDTNRLLLYYWYQSRGRIVASDYTNKLLLMRDSLTLHRSDGALVRVVTPASGGLDGSADALAFITALYPALVNHLPQ